jgi:hypothetical protein
MSRGQSTIVGVVLVLGLTLVALGTITAGIGVVVSDATARADADRVADGLDRALEPVETTGHRRRAVRFSTGQIRVLDREVRILRGASPVRTISTDALVYSARGRRVAFVTGAIVRGRAGNAWTLREPPITASRGTGGVLVVGAARLNTSYRTISGTEATVALTTNVSHDRQSLGTGTYAVAIETTVPEAFERAYRRPSVTTRRADFDGDGVESIVLRFNGTREGHLVVHDMRLEVA